MLLLRPRIFSSGTFVRPMRVMLLPSIARAYETYVEIRIGLPGSIHEESETYVRISSHVYGNDFPHHFIIIVPGSEADFISNLQTCSDVDQCAQTERTLNFVRVSNSRVIVIGRIWGKRRD